MDDTTSEATSPHSTSEYPSMCNQSNHAYQWHFQQQQNEGMSHSQATQDQFLQGDASSRQASLGGRRAKLSEHEKRERKRLNHVKFRQRKKDMVNQMAAQNQHFQDEIRHLSAENRQLKAENGGLSTENRQLKAETGLLSTENRHLKAEIGRLSTENRQLKAENEGLSTENRQLKAETGPLSTENRHLKAEIGRLSTENRHLKAEIGRLSTENRHLKAENGGLSTGNRHLKAENGGLSTANRQLKAENGGLSTENGQLKAETGLLSAENRHLKAEIGGLSAENRHLKEETRQLYLKKKLLEEHIRGLRGKGQFQAEVPERQDSYISRPTSQVDQQNVHVQDYHETQSNNDGGVYSDHHFMEDIHTEGALDELFDINELLIPISRENEMTSNGPVAVNEPVIEHPGSSQSCLCPTEVAKIKLQKFLTELDAEVMGNVDPSDFTGLEGEHRRIGRFSFPSSLIPTVERIKFVYGDVSEKCRISPYISGTIYVLFCATIKEMEHRQLEKVTESIMLKWRDVIKDALLLGFNVRFAMEHLKEIASAYFGLPGRQFLQRIDAKVLTLEAEMNDWRKKRAMIYEESKMSIDAAEKFIGVPVSTGLFSRSSSDRTMHC